ncbi:MAG: AAA family ATPase [Chloroflexota bacterium]
MRLLSVRLQNIKSYGDCTIPLSPGVNAVSGLNGSGKTTVLEAVGFALFDALPYKQRSFLREGCRFGTVSVHLAARDGREYEIVRRIGIGSEHYVEDVESGLRLADRADTLEWVRDHALDVDRDIELRSLFTNAVGVPQGTMTAIFHEPAGHRKKTFDPLLRVEEYREAYEQLRETASYFRDQERDLTGEIAHLEDDVGLLPRARADLNSIRAELQDLNDHYVSLGLEQQTLREDKDRLDSTARMLVDLDRELTLAESREDTLSRELAVAEARVAEAVEAESIVGTSASGYRAVVEARQKLGELDDQRRERDRLAQLKVEAAAAMKEINLRIETLDRELASAREAAQAAEELSEDVTRQHVLEQSVDQAKLEIERACQLEEQYREAEVELARQRDQVKLLSEALEDAKGAAVQALDLRAAREELRMARSEQDEISKLVKKSGELRDAGTNLERQRDVMAEQVIELTRLRREISEQESVAASVEDLCARERVLAEEKAELVANDAYNSVASSALRQGNCPLLDTACPVVAQSTSLVSEFLERTAELPGQLRRLEIDQTDTRRSLDEAIVADRDLQVKRLQLGRLEYAEARLTEVEGSLHDFREKYQGVQERIAGRHGFDAQLQTLTRAVEELEDAARRGATEALLQSNLEQAQSREGACGARVREVGDKRADLGKLRAGLQALEHHLKAIGDPRARQQRLEVLASRSISLAESRSSAQRRLQEQSDRLRAATINLQPFRDLEASIAEERRIEKLNIPDHERYLRHAPEAEKVGARRLEAEAAKSDLQSAHSVACELRDLRKQQAADYDEKRHFELVGRYSEMSQEMARVGERRQQLRTRIQEHEVEMSRLLGQEEKLMNRRRRQAEAQKAGEALGFVRDIIREAGPIVTATLLDNISSAAADIYSDIMDDHTAELRWEQDYAAAVQRGLEVREFAQLSGGEQMSAALAIRLAVLKEMGEVDVAFFDEPTQNLDLDRRANLAEQIGRIRGFQQLFVISHDDSFEHQTDAVIRLRKEDGDTIVEPA